MLGGMGYMRVSVMTVQVLPCWPSGKVSGSTATDMSLIPALAWISFWVESHNSS